MQLHYRKTGEGQPLIILHGLFGSSDNWMSIAKQLENEFEIYLVDQRNHGASPHTDEFNYLEMANDLAKFIDEHHIESPIVMGHSMGGKTAMEFAFQYPDKLSKLVVVDIAPRAYPVHHQAILEGLGSINLSELKSRGNADKALAEYVPELGVRQFLLKNLHRNTKTKAFNWKINLAVINEQIENVGEDITSMTPFDKPTLFLGGANSEYIQESDKAEIHRLFTQASIEMIPNAGHWIHAEQPQAFLEHLLSFLKE